jgi:ComF family protein
MLCGGSLGAAAEAVNLKRMSAVDNWSVRALRVLLPPRCLLCGTAGDGRDLCGGCATDLAVNRPACQRCALPLAVAAPLCAACVKTAPPFTLAWAPFRYGHPLDLLEARFKFRADLAAGRVLADLLVERARLDEPPIPDAIVPVPLHRTRLRARGYNQALELARPLARAFGIPLRHDLLLRARATDAQSALDAKARRRNVRGAFVFADGAPLPAHVALFDDVMTTGATLREAALTLRRAGVARVDAWVLARAP